MTLKRMLFPALVAASLTGCRPDPIEIEVLQSPAEMTISSYTPDAGTCYVSAGYSVSSLRRLIDTSTVADYKALPDEMLVDSAVVVLLADGGSRDTLRKVGNGLYGRKDLNLQPNTGYTLIVEDLRKGQRVTARTVFMPQAALDTMYVYQKEERGDTLSRLRIRLSGAQPGERLLICYNTTAAMRQQQGPLRRNLSALYDFQPRRLEILRVPDTAPGVYETDVTLQVEPRDTVLVQVSRIDGGFSEYLNAYKRSGSFFSRLSGEPVNLPGNVQKGFGYFSMYLSRSALYNLGQP